jgi:hypothetical protein
MKRGSINMLLKYSKYPLQLFLFFFAFQSPAFALGKFDKQDFREYVKTEMKKWDVPGAAVLLIKNGVTF